jgi:hypothetical protein
MQTVTTEPERNWKRNWLGLEWKKYSHEEKKYKNVMNLVLL